MKNLILVITILIGTTATAQNWSLVMPNDTLVYEKQDNHQFFTVWVDSTHVNGMDITYFMNRISPGELVGQGDTSDICLGDMQYSFGNINIRKKYKSQFCGERVHVNGSKTTVLFLNTSFVIYPNNAVGTSWVCDSINSDTMRIVSKGVITLPAYQVQDSIKTFEINGKTFTLSKNHGLISNFNLLLNSSSKYNLVGVQNRALGDTIPMNNDFFEFDIGDIFFRHVGFEDSEGNIFSVIRQEITSKSIMNDTVLYEINNGLDTLKYWVGMNPLLSGFPNTLAVCNAINFDSSILHANPIMVVYVFRNDSGQIEKRSIAPYGSGLAFRAKAFCDLDTGLVEFSGNGAFTVYQSGLGVVSEFFDFGLYTEYDFLAGYILNGTPFGDTTSIDEIDYSNFIKIFPNPSNNLINITTEKLNGISILEIYDLRGRLIITKTFERDLTFDVSAYQPGIYFAVIKDNKGVVLHREKLVIQ